MTKHSLFKHSLILATFVLMPLIASADIPVRPSLLPRDAPSWGSPESATVGDGSGPKPHTDVNIVTPEERAANTAAARESIKNMADKAAAETPSPGQSTDSKGDAWDGSDLQPHTDVHIVTPEERAANTAAARESIKNMVDKAAADTSSPGPGTKPHIADDDLDDEDEPEESPGGAGGSGPGPAKGGGKAGGKGPAKGGGQAKDYDWLTPQDAAMAPQNPPGAPQLPSKCMEQDDCKMCFDEARAGMDKTRLNLEKVRGIYSYTHKFTSAGIAFMQGVANQAGGVASLGAQVETVKVNGALDDFDATVAAKNIELLEVLKGNLMEVAACEAEYYKNDDWFDRYGFTYYQFMQANYSYVEKPGL
ncbi:MAG: hypothetical protein Q8Q73_02465 [Stagnimonas sp.]|nr:hypothetical protein [Stagnimonas sp.]